MIEEKKPEISIIGSAYRPQYWMDIYESIGDNDTNFEIIFVGPNEPNFKLPDNFRFIKSHVKPVQCCDIAIRNSLGNLIINTADDTVFKTKKPIDKLYNEYKSYNNDKIMLSCRFMINGVDASYECHRYNVKDPDSPIMPVSGLMPKKLYRDVGGIDKNFLGIYWEADIAMRIYALGGRVVLSKDVYINEEGRKSSQIKLFHVCQSDKGLFDSLWVTNGKIHFKRTRPVESFSDNMILVESQGPKGKWV